LKQIAGRAGRSSSDGYVTALYPKDLEFIRKVLGNSVRKGKTPTDFNAPPEIVDDNFKFSSEQMQIGKACLFPTISDVINIANKLQVEFNKINNNKVSLYDVFLQFDIHSNSNNLYFIIDLKERMKAAYVLRDIDSSYNDQFAFVMTPSKTKDYNLKFLRKFFIEFNNKSGKVLIPEELYINKLNFVNRVVKMHEINDLQTKLTCNSIK
jgi:hypothetical protein